MTIQATERVLAGPPGGLISRLALNLRQQLLQ